MAQNMKKIEEEALQLSSSERAELAEHLINSLDEEEDPQAEALWIKEAEFRYEEYKKGNISAKPSDLVFKETRSKLG